MLVLKSIIFIFDSPLTWAIYQPEKVPRIQHQRYQHGLKQMSKQDELRYTCDFQSGLEAMRPPRTLHCKYMLYKDPSHSKARYTLVLDIFLNILGAHTPLFQCYGRQGAGEDGHGVIGGLPGCKLEAKPFGQQSIYWHNVWLYMTSW